MKRVLMKNESMLEITQRLRREGAILLRMIPKTVLDATGNEVEAFLVSYLEAPANG